MLKVLSITIRTYSHNYTKLLVILSSFGVKTAKENLF